jgi:hypothetical protein
VPESELQSLADATEKNIQNADPPALSAPENWWPVILEQMKGGFL